VGLREDLRNNITTLFHADLVSRNPGRAAVSQHEDDAVMVCCDYGEVFHLQNPHHLKQNRNIHINKKQFVLYLSYDFIVLRNPSNMKEPRKTIKKIKCTINIHQFHSLN
jgi:hypothetical protein